MPTSTLDTTLLADRLIGTVDRVRDRVHGRLGTRHHIVHVVRRTWSGQRRGEGTPTDVELELTPRPRVRYTGLHSRLRPAGREEEGHNGHIELTEVSLTFGEDELDPTNLASNEDLFYRIRDAAGQQRRDRFYVLAKPPEPRKDGPQDWRITLRRVEAP